MFCHLKGSLCSVSTHTFGKTEQNCDRGDKDSVGRAKGKENSECNGPQESTARRPSQPEDHRSQGRVNEGKVSRRDQIMLSLGWDSEWNGAYLAPKAPSFIPNSGFRKLTHPF